jgi:hypothetical protein
MASYQNGARELETNRLFAAFCPSDGERASLYVASAT